MPIGFYRNGKFFAVHTDHLGTPRLVTDEAKKPVWQLPYSAFGNNKPTGVLQATLKPVQALTNQPVLLKATAAVEFNLRFPGQYFDAESNLNYNYFRTYAPGNGRYTQPDPIGLDGGENRFGYVGGNPLSYVDPSGKVIFVPLLWGVAAGGATAWAAWMTTPGGQKAADISNALSQWMFAKPPKDAKEPEGAKAPGKPGEAEGLKDPKGGENWVRNPNGRGYGWQGADGGVWCPTGPDTGSTGDAHGGPHWDVQYPGGRYDNVYPGGRRR
ncbi:polymorphic toxin type 37 domain-containing protein [Caenimonas koreensis]|nr:RHS repeat-associated core domain-containing protein [Caenimonas koreensis]